MSMTKTKKLFAFLMAALLALPLYCTIALAADPPTHTFVVEKDLGTHTEWADKTNKDAANNPSYYDYKLFQMFTGTITTINNKKVLGNVEWGTSVPETTQEYMYGFCELDGTSGKEKTAQKVADTLASRGDAVFHQILDALKNSNNSGYTGGTLLTEYDPEHKSLTYGDYLGTKGFGVTELPEGYYFVRNDLIPTDCNESYSDYIVFILGDDVKATPKSGNVPTTNKEVQDRNDTIPTATDLNKLDRIADHDIGDEISYKLTATLPSNFADYDKYELTFLDNLCAGLTYNTNAKIHFGYNDTEGTAITLTSRNYGSVDGETDARFAGGKHLEYTIPDLKDEAYESYKLQAGQPVTIEYTATLNSQAVVGVAGNPNEYTVRFSNNPSNTDNKSTTPPNTAIVLTYKFVFNKYDDERKLLTGADFELYKFVTDNNAQNGVWTKVTELHAGTSASNPTKVVSSNGETSNSVFTFSGLDDGDYKLVETVTPAGYNTVKDMYFTVSAGHTIKADDSVDLSLTGAKTTAYGESADITLAPYNESGSLTGLTANVVNPSGSKLPETGGIGTTIFYIVGGTLMVVSAVAFVTKRRMRTSA